MRTDAVPEVSPPLVEWSFFESRMAWGVVMLMGSGYALAEASEETGLSAWIGEQLEGLGALDAWQISLVVSVMAAVLTQVQTRILLGTLSLAQNMYHVCLYFTEQ